MLNPPLEAGEAHERCDAASGYPLGAAASQRQNKTPSPQHEKGDRGGVCKVRDDL